MKKKILLVLLAVGLLVVGLAGGAYAVGSHNPVQGDKLVGYGPLGQKGEAPMPVMKDSCHFTFTNPDCVNDIFIERVSIVDGGGAVIYEGPYLRIQPDGTRVPMSVLKPHRVGKVELWNWMPDGSGGWLPNNEARELPVKTYTVEIEWSARGVTCPLIGQGMRTHISIIPGHESKMVSSYVPMLNMTGRSG